MSWLVRLLRKLRALFNHRQLDADMAEEMRHHLELQTEENLAAGMSPDKARRAAQRQFGHVEVIKETCRDQRGFQWVYDLLQDLSHGLHLIRKHWIYSTFVVVIMAFGIGSVTSVSSVINAIAVRKLPVHNPDQLARISTLQRGFETYSFYEILREENQTASDVMAIVYAVTRGIRSTGNDTIVSALTEKVSGNFFTCLGVQAVRGRTLATADDQKGNPGMVAVISYKFWQTYFSGSEDVVGQSLILGDTALTIVGVMPPEFHGVRTGYLPAIWLPLSLSPLLDGKQPWGISGGRGWLNIMARLHEHVTLQQAQTEFNLIHQRALKNEGKPKRSSLFNERPFLIEDGSRGFNLIWILLRQQLFILLGMTGAALLIACANLSSLILVRSAARNEEISIRMALGASRNRIIRQLATEGLILILIGSLLGTLLAGYGARLLTSYLGSQIDVTLDIRVLGWTALLMIIFGSLCSVIPAWVATNRSLTDGIKNRFGGTTSRNQNTLSRVLVTAQIGLSFLLITTAALLQQTLSNLQTVDVGYNSRDLLMFTLTSDPGLSVPQRVELYNRTLSRLREHPDVRAATMSGSGLFSNIQISLDYSISNKPSPTSASSKASTMIVEPSFFSTMEMPLVAGTGFEQSGMPISAEGKRYQHVVVSRAFAQKHFTEPNPVGNHFRLGRTDVEIVGITNGIPFTGLREAAGSRVDLFLNYAENPRHWRFPIMFEVRSKDNRHTLASDIQKIISEISPNATVSELRSMDDRLAQLINRERSNARIATYIACFASLLAGLGLFGVLTHSTQMKSREIGIRMALGAHTGEVIWGVLRSALIMTMIGIATGLAGYLGISKIVASQLYRAEPLALNVLCFALLALLSVTTLACWFPAKCATKVDPMVALRSE